MSKITRQQTDKKIEQLAQTIKRLYVSLYNSDRDDEVDELLSFHLKYVNRHYMTSQWVSQKGFTYVQKEK